MRKGLLGRSYPVGADGIRPRLSDRGIGVVLVMLSVLVLTVLTAGIVVNARRDIYSSFNYRIDSQAAYVADAGLQTAVNWFKNSYSPANASAYNLNVSPVQTVIPAKPVKLEAGSGANYPDSTVLTSFQTNVANQTVNVPTSPPLNATITVKATLDSARMVNVLGQGPTLLERWLVTSQGKAGAGIAQASLILTSFSPGLKYAAVGCSSGLGSVTVGGTSGTPPVTGKTDSYNSSVGPYGGVNVGSQGNVASNGDVHLDGATINGNLSYGSGYTNYSGVGTVSGTKSALNPPFNCGLLPLPSTSAGASDVSVTLATSPMTLSPGSYKNVFAGANTTLTLSAGTYNFNALRLDGGPPGAQLKITGPTIINIVGTATFPWTPYVLSLDSNTLANIDPVTGLPRPPSSLIIYVNRTDPVKVGSGSGSSFVLIAPNSDVLIDSNGQVYGAIIGKTVFADAGAQIHYDVALQQAALFLSPMTAVAWKRSAN